jgi:glycosyltransferase involved in cell wall biosynthesis
VADRALHIGVDGRELIGQPTGVGRYLSHILRAWIADAPTPHRYTVFVPSAVPAELAAVLPGVQWMVLPDEKGGTIWEQTRLPRALTSARVDVLFAAGYTAPVFCPCPFVVAIYDLSYFAHPEWFLPREGLRRRWLTTRAARRGHSVVTISAFSADEIAGRLGVDRSRIHLAPPGAPPVDLDAPATRDSMVLYVGSLFARRRIPDLVRAFAGTTRTVPHARLELVGANRPSRDNDPAALSIGVAAATGIADRVQWRQYVPDAELVALYRRARVFAFLSDYEGFGMTPSEAIAHGVPPVLLDTPVAREVYGSAAWLVPPDLGAIEHALTTLLTDDARHAALVAAGRARLAAFSWTKSAAAITRALESAAMAATS